MNTERNDGHQPDATSTPPRETLNRSDDLFFAASILRRGLLSEEQLATSLQSWLTSPESRLADILVGQDALNEGHCDLVRAAIASHNRSSQELDDANPMENSTLSLVPGTQRLTGASKTGGEHGESTSDDWSDVDLPTIPDAGRRTTDQRFIIQEIHAEGGLGSVFLANDRQLNRIVALKQVKNRYSSDGEVRQRFLNEGRITGHLEHPGIVPVYGLGTDNDGQPYYAMRLIKGDSLTSVIERFRHDDSDRGLRFRELLGKFISACLAVAYAHSRGVIHRDIKPDNIMVGQYGETIVVDWGLAKRIEEDTPSGQTTLGAEPAPIPGHSIAGQQIGTPAYMSPEQADGEPSKHGVATDVYGLGATLYSILTGRPPCRGMPHEMMEQVRDGSFPAPREVDPDVQPALEAICLRAMAQRPEDRYESAEALADDLNRWLADEPVRAYSEPWRDRVRRWANNHRSLVAGMATGALVLLIAAVVGTIGLAIYSQQLSAAKRETEGERDRSDRLRGVGENLINSFVLRLAKDPALMKTPGTMRLRRALYAQARDYYTKLSEGDEIWSKSRIEGYYSLARCELELGSDAGTEQALNQYLSYAEDERAVELGLSKINRADSYSILASISARRGEIQNAQELFNKASQLMKDVGASEGLARVYHNQAATFVSSGDFDSAIKIFQLSLAVREKLEPNTVNQERRGNTLASLAECQKRFSLATARKSAQKAVYILESTVTTDSTSLGRMYLARAYAILAELEDQTGDRQQAIDRLENARILIQTLVNLYPKEVEYLKILGNVHNQIGVIHMNNGQSKKAVHHCQEALTTRQQILTINPGDLDAQYLTASSLSNLGNAHARQRHWNDAIKAYRSSLAMLKSRDDHVAGKNLVETNLAAALVEIGKTSEALEHYDNIISRQQKLIAERPTTRRRRVLATMVYNRAYALETTEKLNKSLEALNQCDTLLGELAGSEDRMIPRLQKLTQAAQARVLTKRAWLLATHPDDSRRDGKRAMSDLEAASKLVDEERYWLIDTRAAVYAELGRFSEAIQAGQRALELATENQKADLEQRLQLYRKRKPYRQPAKSSDPKPDGN